MKHITKILSPLVLLVFLTGCFDDPGTDQILNGDDTAFVEIEDVAKGNNTRIVTVVPDNEPSSQQFTIALGGTVSDQDVTVSFEVVSSESSAVEGVDFSMVTQGSVTISAGEYTAPVQFNVVDDILDPNAAPKTITFRITDAPVSIIDDYSTFTVSIVGICPPDAYDYTTLEGTYDVSSDGSSTDSCPAEPTLSGYSYTGVTMTLDPDNHDPDNNLLAFTISEAFGGLYIAWYGDCYGYTFETPQTIYVNTMTGAISGNVGSAFNGDEFEMGGRVDSCNGNFTLEWTNVYGDTGTSLHVMN